MPQLLSQKWRLVKSLTAREHYSLYGAILAPQKKIDKYHFCVMQ
jgi:hypothetical protein